MVFYKKLTEGGIICVWHETRFFIICLFSSFSFVRYLSGSETTAHEFQMAANSCYYSANVDVSWNWKIHLNKNSIKYLNNNYEKFDIKKMLDNWIYTTKILSRSRVILTQIWPFSIIKHKILPVHWNDTRKKWMD